MGSETKVSLKLEKDKDVLDIKIIYAKDVWDRLEKSFIKAGLERYTTDALFGKLHAEVYRYTSEDIVMPILNSVRDQLYDDPQCSNVRIIDDINAPIIDLHRLNMAIFRIVPKCNSDTCVTEVKVRDGSLLFTKPHFQCFSKAMKYYIQTLLNTSVVIKWRYTANIEVKG